MQRLHHIGLTVSDTATALDFYRALTDGDVIGPLVKKGPAVEAAVGHPGVEILLTYLTLPDGDAVIELVEYRGGSGARIVPDNGAAGAAHPALTVNDMAASLARVEALGYRALSAPMTATAGPIDGWRYVYVVGPDDVRVELLEPPH
ncbi:VOC family protein [Microbacterium sp. ASV81]|uniref:VOC family protein n=1 Tax=Microbacterium capsulatum TaxID=3041921 RepID=A0ABU0XEW4_9MICO|nr:VOC family protein [Microbacterium sp. ASV81]MDQ4213655.1 VOC family protein [Microbacterium sp. ASV81]